MSAKRVRISSPPSGDQLERSNSTAHPHTAYWESATSMKKLTAESVVSSDKRQRKLTSATAIGQSLPLNHTSPPQSRVAQMSPDPEGDCMPCARRICWRADDGAGLSVSFLIARYRSWPRERCHEDVPLWFRAPPLPLAPPVLELEHQTSSSHAEPGCRTAKRDDLPLCPMTMRANADRWDELALAVWANASKRSGRWREETR